jgi:hypothetical protein
MAPSLVALALGGELLASSQGRFTPREKNQHYQLI